MYCLRSDTTLANSGDFYSRSPEVKWTSCGVLMSFNLVKEGLINIILDNGWQPELPHTIVFCHVSEI